MVGAVTQPGPKNLLTDISGLRDGNSSDGMRRPLQIDSRFETERHCYLMESDILIQTPLFPWLPLPTTGFQATCQILDHMGLEGVPRNRMCSTVRLILREIEFLVACLLH